MSAKAAPSREVTEALADAAAWRVLGLLFERPRAGWHDEIRAVAREIDDPDLRAACEAAREASEGAYLGLFGPGGRVSPREAAYCGTADPAALLADIGAFHAAFAWTARSEDPPDHVAVEVGFAGYLRLKEGYALARGNREEAEIAAEGLARFAENHLKVLAGPLARRLQLQGEPYLAAAARALVARVGDRAESLPLLPDTGAEEPICCPGDEPFLEG